MSLAAGREGRRRRQVGLPSRDDVVLLCSTSSSERASKEMSEAGAAACVAAAAGGRGVGAPCLERSIVFSLVLLVRERLCLQASIGDTARTTSPVTSPSHALRSYELCSFVLAIV